MNITADLKFLYHRRFVDGTRCAGASITTGQVTKWWRWLLITADLNPTSL